MVRGHFMQIITPLSVKWDAMVSDHFIQIITPLSVNKDAMVTDHWSVAEVGIANFFQVC
jgi:hypothetical protein